MLDLYVLYACMHIGAGKPYAKTGKTQCVESRVYFHADDCKRKVPKGGGLSKQNRYTWSWLECKETRADSWIAADANVPGSQLYKAEASVADANALAALLAPLSPQARATLAPDHLKGAFQRAFRGPGNLSFFIVGTGSRVIAFALTHLDDFQFADMAADVSSSSEQMTTEKDLDFDTIAENAGVKLSYHTEMSQRAMPPPGGVEAEP